MITATMTTFGEYIREIREVKGWSITRCAGIAGMSPQQWGNYENDRSRRSDGKPSRPSYETCERIAKALGESVSAVVRAAGFAPTTELTYEPDDEDIEVIAAYRGLGADIKPAVKELILAAHRERQRSQTTHGKKVE